MSHFLTKRGEYFYYFRRVPSHLRQYDSRSHIRVTLKTKDPIEAQRRALVQNSLLEKYWQSLVIEKRMHSLSQEWQNILTLTRAYGFSYRLVEELEKDATEEVIERIEVLEKTGFEKKLVNALTGINKEGSIHIGAALQFYFDLTQDRLIGKSNDFIRKWKNPRRRAVKNFIQAVSDKSLPEISRRDMAAFRAWWMERITKKQMNPSTGGKDMVHLKDIIRVVAQGQEMEIDVEALFASSGFKSNRSSRASFEAEFVQNNILNKDNLKNLNTEAQALIYIMADTGARVSEVVGLLPEDIILDAKIPYIWIRPNKKRTLKNYPSERKIPLVGAALQGIKMMPEGFPRYDIADSVSNLVNQYMMDHGLRPTPSHTLYSLRHTFKDRLRDIGAPEEVIDELMGHSGHRSKYGRGHMLKTKYEWLRKIAFTM